MKSRNECRSGTPEPGNSPLKRETGDELCDETGHDIVPDDLLFLDEAQKGELARRIAALLPRGPEPCWPRHGES